MRNSTASSGKIYDLESNFYSPHSCSSPLAACVYMRIVGGDAWLRRLCDGEISWAMIAEIFECVRSITSPAVGEGQWALRLLLRDTPVARVTSVRCLGMHVHAGRKPWYGHGVLRSSHDSCGRSGRHYGGRVLLVELLGAAM